MPRSYKQKEKLFRILSYLYTQTDAGHGVSVAQVISHLAAHGIEAERKSIYDDFLVLEDLGFPVCRLGTRPETYALPEKLFTLAECKILADAVQACRFVPVAESRALIEKLETLVGCHSRGELARDVYIEHRAKTPADSPMGHVDKIHGAIHQNKRLSFAYFAYDSKKQKVLRHGGRRYVTSPYALVWNDENYYLIAYDEEACVVKHFRVDKMVNVEICKEDRTITESFQRFDPALYSTKAFGMYGGEETLVTLECAEHLAGVIIDRFGMEPTFFPSGDTFRVSLRVMVSPNFYSWVMSFGTDMKILSPAFVREEFLHRLHRLFEHYKS